MVALSAGASALGGGLARWRPARAAASAPPLQAGALALGCLFLASVGAPARLAELLVAGPSAALVAATVLATHGAVLVGGAALCNRLRRALRGRAARLRPPRIDGASLVLASNANVGGAGTAVAMAGALGHSALIAPAAVCGAVGYACATALGVALHALLLR